jgi:hypothetical protein
MPVTGAQVMPAEIPQLRCPRCWAVRPFIPSASLTWRCTGCEWPWSLAAPTVAAPAIPTSGTATTNLVANSTGTVVDVNVIAGTVTKVYVNGADTGQTSGHVYVPVGGTVSITYSVAPTWTWALPVTNAGVTAGGTALPFAAWGTAFTRGQVLIADPAGASDVVTVSGTPTGTSVPVNSLGAAHNSGVSVTVAVLAPYLSSVEAVPVTAY